MSRWAGAVALVATAAVGVGWIIAIVALARSDDPPLAIVIVVVAIGSTMASAVGTWLVRDRPRRRDDP